MFEVFCLGINTIKNILNLFCALGFNLIFSLKKEFARAMQIIMLSR